VPGVGNAPLGLYPCKPGGPNDYVYIMTSRANPEHWTRLLTLMGREDLVGDPRYATPKDRVEREAEVDEIIAHWTRGYTKFEAMELVGGAGIPAGAVLDTMELMQDETFDQRGIVQTLHHPELGAYKVPAWPVRINGKPITVTTPPGLGQHGAEVLGKWLGVTEADAAALKKDGIIG
jgi:formyl-CoA transferase